MHHSEKMMRTECINYIKRWRIETIQTHFLYQNIEWRLRPQPKKKKLFVESPRIEFFRSVKYNLPEIKHSTSKMTLE